MLGARQAIHPGLGPIAVQQPVHHQGALDPIDGGQHAGIVRFAESDRRQHQQRGVHLIGAVVLGEPAAGRDGVGVDLVAHGVSRGLPQLHLTRQPVLTHGPNAPVERGPVHRPRMREQLRFTANLPDAVVGLPDADQRSVQQRPLQRPRGDRLTQSGYPGGMQGDHHLAHHVRLILQGGPVADPHRTGPTVTRQVGQLPLGQVTLARHPVHDLHLGRVAGDRAQQPVAPVLDHPQKAVRDQGLQSQRRVAQPHVAVVPVAEATEVLRQRRGRRRDDAAGVAVRQRPQHEQRAHQHFTVHVVGVDPIGPGLPPVQGAFAFDAPVECERGPVVGRVPGQGELAHLPRADPERAGMGMIGRSQRSSPDDHGVGTRHRRQRVGRVVAVHPRHGPGVVEAQPKLVTELDRAAHPDDAADHVNPAHHVEVVLVDGHEVVHLGLASVRGLPAGDQHERVAVVAAHRARSGVGRTQLPTALLVAAEQRAEHRAGVVAGQAEPVDRPVARHQRRGAAIAQQRIVLDRCGHHATVPRGGMAGRSRPFGLHRLSRTGPGSAHARPRRRCRSEMAAPESPERSR